jgi:hypothetical protein
MAMKRQDDKDDRTYFRSDRIFYINGKWYFSSREGEIGPYATREEADRMLQRFIFDKVALIKFQRAPGAPEKLTTLHVAERERNAERDRNAAQRERNVLKATSTRTITPPEILI